MNDFNCCTIHVLSLLCEKILTFYICIFLAYFKTGSCRNLEILWIQDSKRCTITIKGNEKETVFEGIGMELLLKEYIKIKDPDE